jgi:hypothetical protein
MVRLKQTNFSLSARRWPPPRDQPGAAELRRYDGADICSRTCYDASVNNSRIWIKTSGHLCSNRAVNRQVLTSTPVSGFRSDQHTAQTSVIGLPRPKKLVEILEPGWAHRKDFTGQRVRRRCGGGNWVGPAA